MFVVQFGFLLNICRLLYKHDILFDNHVFRYRFNFSCSLNDDFLLFGSFWRCFWLELKLRLLLCFGDFLNDGDGDVLFDDFFRRFSFDRCS